MERATALLAQIEGALDKKFYNIVGAPIVWGAFTPTAVPVTA
jgi:hypothetical protein